MLTEPEVVELAAQPYVAIRARVIMQTMGTVLPELHPQVFTWLAERDVPPAWLAGATTSLLQWAARQDLAFDVKHAEDGDRWVARLEIYETDPDPDMSKWTTQLLFRLS